MTRARGRGHGGQRGEAASRKDVAPNEIVATPETVKDLIGDGDGLETHEAVVLEAVAANLKKSVEIFVSHRLDHLDGDQLVVGSFQVPVIHEQQGYPVRETSGGYTLLDQIMLGLGNGSAGHPAAVTAGGVDGGSTARRSPGHGLGN